MQFPVKLQAPSNNLFTQPRETYPSNGLHSQPSSIYSSSSPLIVLTPDNFGHCTVTLLGPTTSNGTRANTFSTTAYDASINYLSSQQAVCYAYVSDEHACSVAITFALDILGQIPMLRDGLRECEQNTPEGDTPHLVIEMAETSPVAVWALVDLLACVISCNRQTYKGINHQVNEICKHSMQGIRPDALADLLLVRS